MAYDAFSGDADQIMRQLTLAQRAVLHRVAHSGSIAKSDLTAEEIHHAERLVERGVLREITVIGVASREPVRLKQVLTYVCTPLGISVAKLLE